MAHNFVKDCVVPRNLDLTEASSPRENMGVIQLRDLKYGHGIDITGDKITMAVRRRSRTRLTYFSYYLCDGYCVGHMPMKIATMTHRNPEIGRHCRVAFQADLTTWRNRWAHQEKQA